MQNLQNTQNMRNMQAQYSPLESTTGQYRPVQLSTAQYSQVAGQYIPVKPIILVNLILSHPNPIFLFRNRIVYYVL